jgi:hypothetical protein
MISIALFDLLSTARVCSEQRSFTRKLVPRVSERVLLQHVRSVLMTAVSFYASADAVLYRKHRSTTHGRLVR